MVNYTFDAMVNNTPFASIVAGMGAILVYFVTGRLASIVYKTAREARRERKLAAMGRVQRKAFLAAERANVIEIATLEAEACSLHLREATKTPTARATHPVPSNPRRRPSPRPRPAKATA